MLIACHIERRYQGFCILHVQRCFSIDAILREVFSDGSPEELPVDQYIERYGFRIAVQ